MILLAVSMLFGGYAGCGNCCFKEPRPAQCLCDKCSAEVDSSSLPKPTPPAKPPLALQTGVLTVIEENCLARGGVLEVSYSCGAFKCDAANAVCLMPRRAAQWCNDGR